MRLGGFLVELIARIRGLILAKKGLFLQTKGGVEEQKWGNSLEGFLGYQLLRWARPSCQPE